MDSPRAMTSSHQAIMKCPWQWREPFLDEKRESRKRKAGDGCFYDPVDPSFVDHLLPGYAKKLCTDTLEMDEKEKIQREIERLQLKKEAEHDAFVASAAMIYDALFVSTEHGDDSPRGHSSYSSSSASSADADGKENENEVSTENQALVDSILLMTKAVEEASQASSLLASPLSDSSSSDEEDMDSGASSSDESGAEEPSLDPHSRSAATSIAPKATDLDRSPSPSLELMSDNIQETFISVDDDDLLDFDSASPDAKRDQ